MNQTDLLRAELERLFELEELLNLSRDLLGFDPDAIGGTAAKGSFAGALTGYCREQDALEALCDALLALRPEANPDLTHILSGAFADNERLESGSSFGPYTIGRATVVPSTETTMVAAGTPAPAWSRSVPAMVVEAPKPSVAGRSSVRFVDA